MSRATPAPEVTRTSAPTGVVYLLHLDRRYQHAGHYIGFATDLQRRVNQHRRGLSGARFMEVVAEAGIGFTVARTWENATRGDERKKKRQGGASRLCPICKAAVRAAEVAG